MKAGNMIALMKSLLKEILTIALAGVAFAAFGQSDEDTKLESFFKTYLEKYFVQQPLSATRLGDHRFDNQLDDISKQARDGWVALARETLKKLPAQINYGKLSRDGQIDFEIFRDDLKTQIWQAENMHPFEEDPRTYGNYINDGAYLLLTQSTLPLETNVANCIARLEQIPRILTEAKKTLAHPPKPILETAIRQNRGSIDFYEKGIFELAANTIHLDKLKSAAAPVATELKDFQRFLEGDLMARATGNWRLGKKKFYQKFELETEAGMTGNQTFADAQVEFERVTRDMFVISCQLWSHYFPQKPLPPDDQEGRRETITKVIDAVDQEHGRPEDLVTDARSTVERIKTFIRDHDYLRLPEPDRCQVIEMPEFRRGNSLAYLENAPPLDPKAASYYAVSPPPSDWKPQQVESFLEEYNQHMLQILTIHEGYPGHYVQLEYANRTPSLIRRVLQNGPFVEGWAVYTANRRCSIRVTAMATCDCA